MPLNPDSFVQPGNTGSFNGTSGTVSLSNTTTAGSTVLLIAVRTGADKLLDPPTGFSWATDQIFSGPSPLTFAFYKTTAGGETSWTLAFAGGASDQVVWAIYEIDGLDMSATPPFHVASTDDPFSDTSQSTIPSTATSDGASYDTMAFCIFSARSASVTEPNFSGHTNGFAELHQVTRNNGSIGMGMSVAMLTSQQLQSYQSTASLDSSMVSRALMLVFSATGARWAPSILNMTGFEFGTATSMTVGSGVTGMTGRKPADAVTGSPVVTTSTPKTGTYCLELSSSAAAENITWVNPGCLTTLSGFSSEQTIEQLIAQVGIYFPSSLPGADVELLSIEQGSLVNGVTVWYRNASQKIGVKVGTGTEQVSDATVSADKWLGLDLKYDPRTTTHACDWQLDYDTTDLTGAVAQTQATGTGMTAGNVTTFRLGWTTSKTATVRYDDVAVSMVPNNYPIGKCNIRLLKVDPAGTPTTDNDTNFKVFTSNGTIGAWNATNAKNALDDVPPTIGASSDGITQVTAATGQYMKVPMETYTAAPSEVLRAAKVYLAGWAAAATSGTIEAKQSDGTNSQVFMPDEDHNFDNAALVWACDMFYTGSRSWNPKNYYLLTQARLDGMELHIGSSGDATPDQGVHTLFAELMTQPATEIEVINAESGTFVMKMKYDKISEGIVSFETTVQPGTRGCTVYFTISGADSEHYVTPDPVNPVVYTKAIGATGIDEVTSYGLTADPA